MEQDKFLECINEILAIARTQQNQLTTEEIHRYLAQTGLSETQYDAVYQYLRVNQVTVLGYTPKARVLPKADTETASGGAEPANAASSADAAQSDNAGARPMQTRGQRKSSPRAKTPSAKNASAGSASPRRLTKAERNLELYRREVASVAAHTATDAETAALWARFLTGDTSPRDTLIHTHLDLVFTIAKTYEKRGIALDEMIAEGNLGILDAFAQIHTHAPEYLLSGGIADLVRIQETIEAGIRHAIEEIIDQTILIRDQENALTAKANLIREAEKYLAQENGRTATLLELTEYTRIPPDEIRDIKAQCKED